LFGLKAFSDDGPSAARSAKAGNIWAKPASGYARWEMKKIEGSFTRTVLKRLCLTDIVDKVVGLIMSRVT
jgi:hypothetical protein